MKNAERRVEALRVASHLGANVAVGERVELRSVDPHDTVALDGDGKAARIWTIERANGMGDRRHRPVDTPGCWSFATNPFRRLPIAVGLQRLLDRAVGAAKINQRIPVAARRRFDFADVDRVIATVVGVDDATFEVADRTFEKRKAESTATPT